MQNILIKDPVTFFKVHKNHLKKFIHCYYLNLQKIYCAIKLIATPPAAASFVVILSLDVTILSSIS